MAKGARHRITNIPLHSKFGQYSYPLQYNTTPFGATL